MKFTRILLGAFLVLGVVGAVAVRPAAAQEMCPEGMLPTIASLHHCVEHAYAQGYIDNAGVAQSLLPKLNAAQAALDRGQPAVAARLLQAFINQVQARAGVHIQADHAAHMADHAQMVIDALSAQ